jgi:transposase
MIRQEKLIWLGKNPFYTERFALFVGYRCERQDISSLSRELKLDWKTVKAMEKEYMQMKLDRAEVTEPLVVGIDEISVRKGHQYRIVVSDLAKRRPIWFGGKDRSEDSLDMFFQWLGPEKTVKIRLFVMDMWKAFEKSAMGNAPKAGILYDKFHVMRHLGEAVDKVRKSEYARLSGEKRAFIKGQKYHLLSRKENLTLDGAAGLRELFKRNRRLYKAYLLKESFDRLWDYRYPQSARKFFDNWKDSLKWQKLEPLEQFANLIERHWEGIAAYCRRDIEDVPLGFVEGLNNKIRVFQRRAYGLRDEEYLRLKVLTCMLPPIEPP